jgi:hypothetical protein
MVFAHALMVLILTISFGVLTAVVIFWLNKGKLVQGSAKDYDYIETGRWDATTLLMR